MKQTASSGHHAGLRVLPEGITLTTPHTQRDIHLHTYPLALSWAAYGRPWSSRTPVFHRFRRFINDKHTFGSALPCGKHSHIHACVHTNTRTLHTWQKSQREAEVATSSTKISFYLMTGGAWQWLNNRAPKGELNTDIHTIFFHWSCVQFTFFLYQREI